jgi:hypothetical protein
MSRFSKQVVEVAELGAELPLLGLAQLLRAWV